MKYLLAFLSALFVNLSFANQRIAWGTYKYMTKAEIESKNVKLLPAGLKGYFISFSSPEPDKVIKVYDYHFKNNKLCSISGSYNVKLKNTQEINTLFHSILNKIRNKLGEPYAVDNELVASKQAHWGMDMYDDNKKPISQDIDNIDLVITTLSDMTRVVIYYIYDQDCDLNSH